MGEGSGRWGPGPEQLTSRVSGSQALPVAPRPPIPLPGLSASPSLPGSFRFHRFDASCCCAVRFGLLSRSPNALLCLWSLARVTSSCSSILS